MGYKPVCGNEAVQMNVLIKINSNRNLFNNTVTFDFDLHINYAYMLVEKTPCPYIIYILFVCRYLIDTV